MKAKIITTTKIKHKRNIIMFRALVNSIKNIYKRNI